MLTALDIAIYIRNNLLKGTNVIINRNYIFQTIFLPSIRKDNKSYLIDINILPKVGHIILSDGKYKYVKIEYEEIQLPKLSIEYRKKEN